jgi:hypothetical protein
MVTIRGIRLIVKIAAALDTIVLAHNKPGAIACSGGFQFILGSASNKRNNPGPKIRVK